MKTSDITYKNMIRNISSITNRGLSLFFMLFVLGINGRNAGFRE